MKQINIILVLILMVGKLFAAENNPLTWDIINKSMTEYSQDGGNGYDRAWSILKGNATTTLNVVDQTHINFTKTGKYAWLRPTQALADLTPNQAYSIEIKARINAESGNQIALRLANKATTPIYLKYGDSESGSISTLSNLSNAYPLNTSEWQIYRIVLRADLKYDVYIAGIEEPLFEGQQGGTNGDQNGIYIGAESDKACNIDIEYVKMGTGDFFSPSKISSITLSHNSHITGKATTVLVTASTAAINDGETLLFSLVDTNDTDIVTAVTGTVTNNVATANIQIPAEITKGRYNIKVAAPDGKIGNIAVKAKTQSYQITGEWDIVDKSMKLPWDQNDGELDAEKAWTRYIGPNLTKEPGRYSFTQENEGYVNITKTHAEANSNSLSFYTAGSLPILPNTAYTFEYKVRINPIDKETYPDDAIGWELNMLIGRLNKSESAIYLGYDAQGNGYLTLEKDFAKITEENKIAANIGEWNTYRFVVSADATKFDLYMNGNLIFENASTNPTTNATNIQSLGSATGRARCNIDIESARMRTGNFGLKTKISSITLSHNSHITGNPTTVQVTVNTASISNDEKLLLSLIDTNGNNIVNPVEITVTDNSATGNITIPANIPAGQYAIKVAAPNDQIGDSNITPGTVPYTIEENTPPSFWDIIDKSMANWNGDDGTEVSKKWGSYIGDNLKNNSEGYSIAQKEGYVNLTKTYVNATKSSALLNSQAVTVATNTPYTIEFKARINPLNKELYPDVAGTGWELNAISARVHKKTTDIYLGYNAQGNGYLTLKKNYPAAEEDRIYRDISDWHIYSMVLSADNKTFDLYIDGELIAENAPTTDMNSATNILRFGTSAEQARCNIDVQYAKMGTGDFYSKPKITSVTLSHTNHVAGTQSTVEITANTTLIDDNEKLLFSLIDQNNNEIVAPLEGTVTNNVATASLVIPANVSHGNYQIKVAAPNGQIGETQVEPKTVPYQIEEENTPPSPWDILDKSMAAWNADNGKETNKAWTLTKGKDITLSPTQESGYVNITKTYTKNSYAYAFLTPQALTLQANTAYSFAIKARVNAINKTTYPDAEDAFESIEISARLNEKNLGIYLRHGDEDTGYMALTEAFNHHDEEKYKINTSQWHVYRFVLHADNSMYDVYIDDIAEPVFENIPTSTMTGSNIIRLGAGSKTRCNLDIESVKMATGDLYSKSKIVSVNLSSDSHVENNARTITVTTNTVLIEDEQKIHISLVDNQGNTIVNPVEAIVSQNKAETSFTIPAEVARIGKYTIKAAAPGGKIGDVEVAPKTADYVIVKSSPITGNLLPNVSPVGFTIDINDYKHIGISKEFISPAILDIKPYLQNGKFNNQEEPLDRYYLFYSPHENPGGIYLATAPTLDGPWTEYAGTEGMTPGTVIDFEWARKQSDLIEKGAERHISACHVIWNNVHNKYFMYFHGPNTTTHYATSDNLRDWTFGKSILNAQSFGSRGNEASYSKVFEHEVPGLGNKYIMLMMIAESSSSRRVYWAHSTDGVDWTGVRKPLVSADLDYKKIPGTDTKPNYVGGMGNNVAASFFMESDGRYFVFFNGSSGNICVAEVGEALDIEVHWGEYMMAKDVIIDRDNNGNLIPLPRVACPMFITDDAGKWYMFFEAGSRLGANIAYAKEPGIGSVINEINHNQTISISGNLINAGQAITIKTHAENISLQEVTLYNLTGNEISRKTLANHEYTLQISTVPGMYILKVQLNNNTSKEFKIIVK